MKNTKKIGLFACILLLSTPVLALYVQRGGAVTPGFYGRSYTNPVGPVVVNPAPATLSQPGALVAGIPTYAQPGALIAGVPTTYGQPIVVPTQSVLTTTGVASGPAVAIVNPPNPTITVPPASAPGLEPYNAPFIPTPSAVNESIPREAILENAKAAKFSSATIPSIMTTTPSKPPCDPFRCECDDVRSQLVISTHAEPPSEVNGPPRGRFIRSLKAIPTTSYSDELPGPEGLLFQQ